MGLAFARCEKKEAPIFQRIPESPFLRIIYSGSILRDVVSAEISPAIITNFHNLPTDFTDSGFLV